MASAKPMIVETTLGRLKLWAKPGERRRRRKSNAALISDFSALKKAIMLCASCEARMPRTWMSRHGYRLLHAFHTEGACDYCQEQASCNLWHFTEGDYVRQWDAVQAVIGAATQQKVELRDRRRIRAVS